MPKSSDLTPGQQAWVDAMLAEPTHSVSVTGPIASQKVATGDDGITRVTFTVKGDNGTASWETVPPLSADEQEAENARRQHEAEQAAAAELAEQQRQVEAHNTEVARAQADADAERERQQREADEARTVAQAEFRSEIETLIDQRVTARIAEQFPTPTPPSAAAKTKG